MAIADDVLTERALFRESLIQVGPSAPTSCKDWTALELAAHVVGEERYGGVTTFIARSLVMRGVHVVGTPKMVDSALRMQRRHGFSALVDRLHQPLPRLLLRPRVVPLTLFEYWTHHDDLIGADDGAHAEPSTLVEVIPFVLRYQLGRLPAGVRLTLATDDGCYRWSVGPGSGPEVILGGTPPDLVRWLSGRRGPSEVTITGPDAGVQALRTFEGRV